MVVPFWACHGLWYGIVIIWWGDRHYLHREHEFEDYQLVGSTPNLENLESEKYPPEAEGSSRLNPRPSIIYTTEHLRVQGSRYIYAGFRLSKSLQQCCSERVAPQRTRTCLPGSW